MKCRYALIFLAVLLVSACNLVEVENPDENTPDPAQEEVVRETPNVTYHGIVQPAGISIYQQGSHRLVLDGGKFILLESDSLDLNGYVGEEVNVYGSLRPTVEAGGMIMRVDRIELVLKDSLSSSSLENSSDSEATEESEESIASADSSASSIASVASVTATSASAASSLQDASSSPSPAFESNIDIMSRQDYAAGNWTQQYCTSHVGFCIPVHRNFWYKSFGATDSSLWHVEFSAEPVESLHEGPIVLELIAGSAATRDGTVDTVDGTVVAYKEWTFGRHFRISGDVRLEQAIRYMLSAITDYTQ